MPCQRDQWQGLGLEELLQLLQYAVQSATKALEHTAHT